MTLWLTALLVWVAAGARVGRVLVKPATTARVAIVIAVAAVAFASTVAIPDIAVAVDNLLPGGVNSGWLSTGLVASAWILFVTATSVVASAAWPVVSRQNLRQIALGIYAIGALAIAVTLAWSFTFGWFVVAAGAVFIVITGLRNLDWTTLGRGIAIYTTGTTVVAVFAVVNAARGVTNAEATPPGEPLWGWPAWEIASLLIALGAVSIVIELWWRAKVLLRRIKPLHRLMVGRFPEVIAPEQNATSTQLKASDQVAQVMDALYLLAGSGIVIPAAGEPPADVAERAAVVAEWARNPLGDLFVDARWIAPPPGVSPRGWALALAAEYDVVVATEEKAPAY
ncbi:hypothetical protein [Nocardia camponoti]|uniref:Uncharacterized protein n=1 Tax=Nocardia camponoti TaxID=1616106 RepID=A0A917QNJ1_9NOCA|nr:hypothetical protein [Nocardia camponoti]GGK59697.1 hypothetical protein GCM10011591_34880 [Nocardia camponoti]